jgi:drug/metabolite transporter (DMT)-like permease
LAVTRLPGHVPGWKETGSLAALGLAGTGVAYILSFVLLQSAGASRQILVTYTIPAVAVFYGWLLLGEGLRAVSLAGLAIILAGVALASRGKRRVERPYTAPVPSLE